MIAERDAAAREYYPEDPGDVVEELIDHLTNRRENHRLGQNELMPLNGRVTKRHLLHVHALQHEDDLGLDYIQAHIRMWEV